MLAQRKVSKRIIELLGTDPTRYPGAGKWMTPKPDVGSHQVLMALTP